MEEEYAAFSHIQKYVYELLVYVLKDILVGDVESFNVWGCIDIWLKSRGVRSRGAQCAYAPPEI